jgi:hypothetical protein
VTRTEWAEATGPGDILDAFGKAMSERKLRLFAIACCRRLWRLIDEKDRRGMEVGELYADGNRCQQTLRRAWRAAQAEAREGGKGARKSASHAAACAVATDKRWEPFRLNAEAAATNAAWAVKCINRGSNEARRREWQTQAHLLRDIFNPWLPSISTGVLAWNDRTVVRIAEAIYEGKRFENLPILADALEESGCMDADILGHCRQPGEHVRGCWVVDLLLGKG